MCRVCCNQAQLDSLGSYNGKCMCATSVPADTSVPPQSTALGPRPAKRRREVRCGAHRAGEQRRYTSPSTDPRRSRVHGPGRSPSTDPPAPKARRPRPRSPPPSPRRFSRSTQPVRATLASAIKLQLGSPWKRKKSPKVSFRAFGCAGAIRPLYHEVSLEIRALLSA
jgi:hypothetical protein